MTRWVGAFVWKFENGLWVMVQDVISTKQRFQYQGVQIKLPGGMSEATDKGPLDTLRREIEGETDLTLLPGEYDDVYNRIIGSVWKTLYLVGIDSLVGRLRTEPEQDGDSLMGAPRWLRVNEVSEKFIYQTQQPAFHEAVRRLQKQNLVV